MLNIDPKETSAAQSSRAWRDSDFAQRQLTRLGKCIEASRRSCQGSVYVAAIGSLLWRPEPGMIHEGVGTVQGHTVEAGVLEGELRGQPAAPGVVLNAIASPESSAFVTVFRWSATEPQVKAYEDRELNGKAYIPALVRVTLRDGRTLRAILLLGARGHSGYVGDSWAYWRAAAIIAAPAGRNGRSLDYITDAIQWRFKLSNGRLDHDLIQITDALRSLGHDPLPEQKFPRQSILTKAA